MQPTKKPMNWLLIIIGLCCLGGICSSVISGAILFMAKSRDKRIVDAANEAEAKIAEELENYESSTSTESGDTSTTEPERLPQPDGQLWVDPDGRFSIVFPTDWTISDPTPAGLHVSAMSDLESDSDGFAENVNVVLETIPDGYSGDDYITAMESNLATLNNYAVVERGSWNQDGNAGAWIEYRADMFEFGTSHNFVFVATEPGQAYVITCRSLDPDFDRWKDQLRSVAETFRLE